MSVAKITTDALDGLPFYECLPLPTPYPVGRVNAYYLPGAPPSLIDAGVRSDRSIEELSSQIEARGSELESLETILLTHLHNDHAGAAPELARRTGARIICHEGSLRDELRSREVFLELIARYGAPATVVNQLRTAWKVSDQFGEPLTSCDAVDTVAHGDMVGAGGVELEVMETPGHSPGHLCFVDRGDGVIFCGDLLLAHITSNPLPHFDESAPRGRQVSLALYLESLAKVEALGSFLGLPGHGSALPDVSRAAMMARQHILARNEKVLRLLMSWPETRLFELAGKFFFQEQDVLGQTLAFCELLAHADLLEERGRIVVDPERGIPKVIG